MPWLKGRSSHAHGYSDPSYRMIHGPATPEAIEATKEEMIEHDLWPDSDGIRKPIFEVLERAPLEVIASEIKRTEGRLRALESYLLKLKAEL